MKTSTFTLGDLERLLIQELHKTQPGALVVKIDILKDGAKVTWKEEK